jgi:hypothetical protein
MREIYNIDREGDGEKEGGKICDFRYISLHGESGTDQVVALAHFYVGCQRFFI